MATNATIDPEKEKADIAEIERGRARMDEVEREEKARETAENISAGLGTLRPTDFAKNPNAPFQRLGIRVPTKKEAADTDARPEVTDDEFVSESQRKLAEIKARNAAPATDPVSAAAGATATPTAKPTAPQMVTTGMRKNADGSLSYTQRPATVEVSSTEQTPVTKVEGTDETRQQFGSKVRYTNQETGAVRWAQIDADGKEKLWDDAPKEEKTRSLKEIQSDMDAAAERLKGGAGVRSAMTSTSKAAVRAAQHNAAIKTWDDAVKLQREGKIAEAKQRFAEVDAYNVAEKERIKKRNALKDRAIGTQIGSAANDLMANMQEIAAKRERGESIVGDGSSDGAGAFVHKNEDGQYYVRGFVRGGALVDANKRYADEGGTSAFDGVVVSIRTDENGKPYINPQTGKAAQPEVVTISHDTRGGEKKFLHYGEADARRIMGKAYESLGVNAGDASKIVDEQFSHFGAFNGMSDQQKHAQEQADKVTNATVAKTNADASAATTNANTLAKEAEAKAAKYASDNEIAKAEINLKRHLGDQNYELAKNNAGYDRAVNAYANICKSLITAGTDPDVAIQTANAAFDNVLAKLGKTATAAPAQGGTGNPLDQARGGRVQPPHRTEPANGTTTTGGGTTTPQTGDGTTTPQTGGGTTTPQTGDGTTTPQTGDGTTTPTTTEPPKTEPSPEGESLSTAVDVFGKDVVANFKESHPNVTDDELNSGKYDKQLENWARNENPNFVNRKTEAAKKAAADARKAEADKKLAAVEAQRKEYEKGLDKEDATMVRRAHAMYDGCYKAARTWALDHAEGDNYEELLRKDFARRVNKYNRQHGLTFTNAEDASKNIFGRYDYEDVIDKAFGKGSGEKINGSFLGIKMGGGPFAGKRKIGER